MANINFSSSGESNKALQDALVENEPRIVASYALLGAIVLLGAIGYGIDRWAGTSPWFLLIGLLIGIASGFGNLVRTLRSH
jgi:F0F1-type ATP synthase assembly protein I